MINVHVDEQADLTCNGTGYSAEIYIDVAGKSKPIWKVDKAAFGIVDVDDTGNDVDECGPLSSILKITGKCSFTGTCGIYARGTARTPLRVTVNGE